MMDESEPDQATVERLLADAVQGDLTPDAARQLAGICGRRPAVAARLAALVRTDRLLGLALSRDGSRFARELGARIDAGTDAVVGGAFAAAVGARVRRGRAVRALSWAAAAVAAVVVAGLFLAGWWPAAPVAEIVRSEELAGELEGASLVVGSRVTIDDGLVELRYGTGVRVILEAPAAYEVTGPNSGYLHAGRLVAEIEDERATGFVIDGAAGRLVDLGTKFGVAVGDDGTMDVHVLEGAVDARATSGETTHLTANEALRLADGGASRLPGADESAFITQLPPRVARAPKFVRWSFDGAGNEIAANSGRGLGGDSADARFRSFSEGGPVPERVAGRYGGALRFDGTSGYLESDFRGIMGSDPRTVAFWVRVPEDSGLLEGYGIVNWGSTRGEGSAWQISVNPAGEEGPIGRLRIGTSGGWVVGTTDLRDGRWHHCAVVMYGDPQGRPNTATHIFLYIDGVREPAGRKSVRVVDTLDIGETPTSDHGIWMGRNLAYDGGREHIGATHGRFFRGDIDEMVICDTALDQESIGVLMRENVLP